MSMLANRKVPHDSVAPRASWRLADFRLSEGDSQLEHIDGQEAETSPNTEDRQELVDLKRTYYRLALINDLGWWLYGRVGQHRELLSLGYKSLGDAVDEKNEFQSVCTSWDAFIGEHVICTQNLEDLLLDAKYVSTTQKSEFEEAVRAVFTEPLSKVVAGWEQLFHNGADTVKSAYKCAIEINRALDGRQLFEDKEGAAMALVERVGELCDTVQRDSNETSSIRQWA